ncbi:hypothetical protein [Sphingomonas sp. Leaf230]|uniref:hypothetical protein n=1 Tax=Sphingomonas sp. Leaf230 TaxID=1735694 RepID=UPI000B130241|nr:hypothetical protein [Sphingomonas sp. Leaf230]
MATAAHSIGASAATTPHLALVALTAPAVTCWTADPRAGKLLASCAALPPVMLEHRSRFGNAVDRWTAFAGYRVEALEAIRMEVGDRLLQAYHQQGPDAYEPFRDWCEQPNASDAVAAVLASSTEH